MILNSTANVLSPITSSKILVVGNEKIKDMSFQVGLLNLICAAGVVSEFNGEQLSPPCLN